MPILRVDFNEMPEPNLVLLSRTDDKEDIEGNAIELRDGLHICVVMEDFDDQGQSDDLVAFGMVERNRSTGWGGHVKWSCRIDGRGIRHRSEINTV